MYRLIETIKCFNGKLYNTEWHNIRFNRSRRNLFGIGKSIDLNDIITIPGETVGGLFRCRVTYSEEIEKIEFIRHTPRKIGSLKITEDNFIDYRHKYANRRALDKLFEERENCDDILIVKNGFVTDSYTANIVFFDGKKWVTPNTPLLPGTQRAKLIAEKKISECRITSDDLKNFRKAGLINAMWNFETMPVIDINNIRP